MIALTKSQRQDWESKYRNRFGISLREIYGSDIDDWDDEDFYEEYQKSLDFEYAEAYGQ